MKQRLDEFEIIKKYFLPLTNQSKQAAGLNDDAAFIDISPNKELVISKDLIVEDIHFYLRDGGYNIASKLLRANLSDLAASGAKPLYYMLGFSKNKNLQEKFIADFCLGLKDSAAAYKLFLIGGDSVSTADKLFFSLTIFGEIKKGRRLSRNQAIDGDLIFISGNIGDAFLGLAISQEKITNATNSAKKYLLKRLYQPTPRIELGINLLTKKLANAAIDISDGLFADLRHICCASKLDAIIYQNQIPLSKTAKSILKTNSNFNIADLASSGDDYELIFTADKKNKDKIIALGKKIGIKITAIGEMKKRSDKTDSEVILLDKKNQKIDIHKYGYLHF